MMAIATSYIGNTAKMRFVSKIARTAKIAALIHICVLVMGGILTTPASAQQLTIPQPGEWAETTSPELILANRTATLAELGQTACTALGNCPSKVHAWTSWSYDPVEHQLWILGAGGHEDWGGTDNYMLDLDDLTTGWVRVTPVQYPLTGALDNNGQCPLPAVGAPANHTYGGVVYAGSGVHYIVGGLAFCKGSVRNPGNLAYKVDVTNPASLVWTRMPDLDIHGGPVAMEIATPTAGPLAGVETLFVMDEDGWYSTTNLATGVTTPRVLIAPVKRNNISMVGTSSFQAQQASGDIADNGFFCTGNQNAVTCSNINGVTVNSANNDAFGRVIRHSFGAGFAGGYYDVIAIPGGRFVLWLGNKEYWTFKPDPLPFNRQSDGADCIAPMTTAEIQACATDGDVWQAFAPATGPTRYNDKVYRKAFLAPHLCATCIVAYPDQNDGVSVLNVETPLGPPPPPPNTPPVANDDAFVGAEELQIAGNVLTNDTDAETTLTATALTIPPVGALTLNPDGSFTYDPEPNFFGVVTFEYTASDGELTDTGTVTLTITDVAEPVDKYICEINEFEFPAGETPEEFPLIGMCHFERAQAELPPPPPPPPPAAESYSTPTFAARAAGSLFANGFDVAPPIGTTGNTDAVFMNGGMSSNQNPVMPHRVTSQDGQGALSNEFLPLSNAGAAGQYWVHFPEPIALGETVHIQWRQKFNAAFVETQFKRYDTGGNTSPKLIIVSRTTSSCQNVEVAVTSTGGATKAPTMYNNCNFFTQIPRLVTWQYPVDTWITFNLTMTKPTAGYVSGQFTFYDVAVKLEAKPDGGDVVTIVDVAAQPMRAMDIPWDAAFFTIYITKKDYAQAHEHAIALLDEVIISKQPIPLP
jgi:hypothetical protein